MTKLFISLITSLFFLSSIYAQEKHLDTTISEANLAEIKNKAEEIEAASAPLFWDANNPATLSNSKQLTTQEDLLKNFIKLGGDRKAFDQITCFYNKYSGAKFSDIRGENAISSSELRFKNKRYITIADFTKPASQVRLFVLDLATNEVKAYFTSHGIGVRGGDVTLFPLDKLTEEKKKSLQYPTLISSRPGSSATPRGVFMLGKTYTGSFGYSLKIHGLQNGINETTYARAVVMHGFAGMNPAVVSSNDDETEIAEQLFAPGNLAVSQGCTMIQPDRAKEVIDTVQGYSLYYNYTTAEKNEAAGYCADKSLLDIKSKPSTK